MTEEGVLIEEEYNSLGERLRAARKNTEQQTAEVFTTRYDEADNRVSLRFVLPDAETTFELDFDGPEDGYLPDDHPLMVVLDEMDEPPIEIDTLEGELDVVYTNRRGWYPECLIEEDEDTSQKEDPLDVTNAQMVILLASFAVFALFTVVLGRVALVLFRPQVLPFILITLIVVVFFLRVLIRW